MRTLEARRLHWLGHRSMVRGVDTAMPIRMVAVAALVATALAFVLAGCANKATPTGLVYRVNPPGVTVQALKIGESGSAVITLRIANFSTVTTTFAELDLELRFGDAPSIAIAARPAIAIPALSADVVELAIDLPASARSVIARGQSTGVLPYSITGRVTTLAPDRRHRVEFESRLSPVPGRSDEFR